VSVSLSVCRASVPRKHGCTDRGPLWGGDWRRLGSNKHSIRCRPRLRRKRWEGMLPTVPYIIRLSRLIYQMAPHSIRPPRNYYSHFYSGATSISRQVQRALISFVSNQIASSTFHAIASRLHGCCWCMHVQLLQQAATSRHYICVISWRAPAVYETSVLCRHPTWMFAVFSRHRRRCRPASSPHIHGFCRPSCTDRQAGKTLSGSAPMHDTRIFNQLCVNEFR